MSANYNVIVNFLIYAQFGAIRLRISDAWSVIFIFSLIATLHFRKIENRTKKSITQLFHY